MYAEEKREVMERRQRRNVCAVREETRYGRKVNGRLRVMMRNIFWGLS
jgi:hypothetical protein